MGFGEGLVGFLYLGRSGVSDIAWRHRLANLLCELLTAFARQCIPDCRLVETYDPFAGLVCACEIELDSAQTDGARTPCTEAIPISLSSPNHDTPGQGCA